MRAAAVLTGVILACQLGWSTTFRLDASSGQKVLSMDCRRFT